jgi:hypothetical protein
MATDYPDRIGTTEPIFIPRSRATPVTISGQKHYVTVRVVAAQCTFHGSILERPKTLVVTSQVGVDHPALDDEPLRAIQRSREIQRNTPVRLGLSPTLISLMPATMERVSISIEFIADVKNRLDPLAALINSDAFVSVASLAPGGAAAAKTLSGVSKQLFTFPIIAAHPAQRDS